jgi:hypothetical protein
MVETPHIGPGHGRGVDNSFENLQVGRPSLKAPTSLRGTEDYRDVAAPRLTLTEGRGPDEWSAGPAWRIGGNVLGCRAELVEHAAQHVLAVGGTTRIRVLAPACPTSGSLPVGWDTSRSVGCAFAICASKADSSLLAVRIACVQRDDPAAAIVSVMCLLWAGSPGHRHDQHSLAW